MANDDATIERLANRLADGIDGAFPELVDTFHGSIFSGVFRLTRDRGDAEDLTQETFVRAYRALGGYPPDRIRTLRLRGWLWTIAINLCRNRARNRSRRPRTSPLELGPDPTAPDSTEAAALAAVDDEWLDRLATLAVPVRQAVVLRHVVGLTYQEISTSLDRPVGTVKSDVHRGLDHLRGMLEREGALQ